MEEKLLKIQDAARILGVSIKTLQRWEVQGFIRAERTPGAHRRYSHETIEAIKRRIALRKSPAYSKTLAPQPQVSAIQTPPILSVPESTKIETTGSSNFQSPKPKKGRILKPLLSSLLAISFLGLLGTGAMLAKPFLFNNQTQKHIPKPAFSKDVLAAESGQLKGFLNVNVPAYFNDSLYVKNGQEILGDSVFIGSIDVEGGDITVTDGSVFADNLLYTLTSGDGIEVAGGQTPTITNTGVISLQGQTGDITLTAGTGISISGTTITNSSTNSDQNIYKTIKVGSDSVSAGSSSDTFEFAAGTGISLALNTSSKILTITGEAVDESGFTDNGADVVLTTITDNVGLGTASPSEKLHVVGNAIVSGTFTLGSDTISDIDGDGLALDSGVLEVDLLSSSGSAGLANSRSGLELNQGTGSTYQLSLLQGCQNGQILKWDAPSGEWSCASDVGGQSQAVIAIQEGTGALITGIDTLRYAASDFDLGSISTTGTISLDASLARWDKLNGAAVLGNTTLDILAGGSSTASAKFGVLNLGSGTPTASISANSGNNATFITGAGNLATTNNQTLAIGGATTGNITLNPLNGSGSVIVDGEVNLTSGNTYQINGTNVLSATTLGSAVVNSSLTSVGTIGTGVWQGTAVGAGYGGTGIDTSGSTGVPTINSGTWSVAAQLSALRGGTGVDGSSASNGQLLIGNGTGYTLATLTAGAGVQISNGSGSITISQTGSGASKWTELTGALYPNNSSLDVLLGGTSTASAKFGFLNIGSGTPTASVSAGASGATYLTASGNLATTLNQTLVLGGSTTGNITLNPLNGSGLVISTGDLNLSSGKVFQINGTSVLSATTLGSNVVNSSLQTLGTISSGTWNATAIAAQYGGTGINTSASTGVPTISGGTWSVAAQLSALRGGTGVDGSSASNGQILIGNGTGYSLATLTAGSGISVSNGAGSITINTTLTPSNWTLANGSLYPNNSTLDVLLGGSASSSAKFGFLNIASGTPTASVSANSGNIAAFLTGLGNLGTTNAQTLTLGGSTTGNIVIDSGSGLISLLDSISISGALTSTGTITFSNAAYTNNNSVLYGTSGTGVLAAATTNTTGLCLQSGASAPSWSACPGSGSGGSKWTELNGLLYPNNATVDVLFGGSASSSAKFAFTGVSGGTPTASISANSGNNALFLTGDGNLATTNGQTLTLGGSTTGNLVLNSGSGLISLLDNTSITGSLTSSGTITFSNAAYTSNNSILYGTSGTGVVAAATTDTSGLCLQSGASAPTWSSCPGSGSGGSKWTELNGLLFPNNSTLDVLFGGTATSSSKFAFTGVSGGTPTASISANSGNNAAFLTGTGNLGTTNMQTLTLGGSTTGNILINPSGTLQFYNANNTLTSGGALTLAGTITANTTNTINGVSINSGAITGTTLSLTNDTNQIVLDSNGSFTGTITLETLSGSSKTYTLPNENGTFCLQNSANCGFAIGTNYWQLNSNLLSPSNSTFDFAVGGTSSSSASFRVVGNNALRGTQAAASVSANTSFAGLVVDNAGVGDLFTASKSGATKFVINNSGNIIFAGGQSSAFTTLASANSTAATFTLPDTSGVNDTFCLLTLSNCAGTNYWDQANGVINPKNASVVDLLLGSNATASAKFGFLNVNSGTPTASISANSGNNATTLSGLGVLATTNKQTLSLGNAATGDINLTINSGNNLRINGVVGITDGSPQCVTTTNGIVTGTGVCQLGSEQWVVSNGSLYTGNPSLDLFLGGTSTASAKFAVLGISSDSPVASVSATSGSGLSIGYDGSIQTTRNNTLTLGGSTTGNISLNPLNGNGFVSVNGELNLTSGNTYQINGTNVLSATTLGTNVVNSSLTSVGTIGTGVWQGTAVGAQYGGTGINTSASTGVPTISSGTWSVLSQLSTALGGLGANVTAAGAGELLYSTGTTTYDSLAAGNSGECLTSGGAGAPTWTNCAGATGITTYWGQANGTLYPFNSTVDLLLGGQATSSSKFGFLNVNSGTPTASISANSGNNSLYLTGSGSIATTNKQTLTIGSSSTGNIVLSGFSAGAIQTNASGILSSGILGALHGGTGINTSSATGVPTISGGTWSVAAQLSTALGGLGADITAAGGGEILYSTGTTTYDSLAAGNSGQCLSSGGTGTPSWINCAIGTNYWQANSGMLSPINSTLDFALGGTSTSSAKFAVLNINSGTPTATISGNLIVMPTNGAGGNVGIGTTNPNSRLDVRGNIFLGEGNGINEQQRLVSDGVGAALRVISPNSIFLQNGAGTLAKLQIGGTGETGASVYIQDTGNVGFGSLTPEGLLHISGGNKGGNSTLIVNQTGATSNDIIAASASGVTRFRITNNGDIQGGFGQTALSTITKTGATARTFTLPDESGTICLQSSTNCGFLTGTNYWQLNSNALSQSNNTFDVLFGGTSTASAKFAFLNNAGGTPTASISANSGNIATTLTGTGELGTTNRQTLTLGSSTTGDVNLAVGGSNNLRINGLAGATIASAACVTTTNGLVTGSATCDTSNDPFTIANGLIYSGNTTYDFALGGSSTSSAKFAVLNMNSGTPTASISANSGNNAAFLSGLGNLGTTNMQTLTLGGSSTGNIVLNPGNGGGNVSLSSSRVNAGGILDLTASGTITSGNNAVRLTANSVTTGNALAISATGITSGTALSIAGSTTTGVGDGTGLNGFVEIASDVGSTGAHGNLLYLNPDFSNSSGTSISSGILVNATDSTSSDNSDGGVGVLLTLTGNANKSAGAFAGSITSSSNIGDNLVVYDAQTTVTGILGSSTTRNVYGLRSLPAAGAESTAGTTNVYGVYSRANGDVGAGGTINTYGIYLADPANDTDGTSTNFGLYLEDLGSATLADNNYGICFDCDGTYNTSTSVNGITWGTDINSTNLYRSASKTLRTDGALDIRSLLGTSPAASISANTTFASLLADNRGAGDLFTASKAGETKFVITNTGNLQFKGNTSFLTTLTSAAGNNTVLTIPDTGDTDTICLLTLANCTGGATTNYWQLNSNALSQGNNTFDVLLGGTSTASAKFAFLNNAGGTPTASISANTGNNAAYLSGLGVLGTVNKQSLTLGSTTTGLINVLNGSGNIFTTFDTVNSTLSLGNTGVMNGVLTFLSSNAGETSPTIAAEADGDLTLSAATGTINLGSGTGDIAFNPGTNNVVVNLASTGDFIFQDNGTTFAIFDDTRKFGLGTTTPLASFDVRHNQISGGTIAVASISGTTSFAALAVDNNGAGDIFTASKSGETKFVITNTGNLQFKGNTSFLTTLTSAAGNDTILTIPDTGSADTICLLTLANCTSGSTNYWQLNSNALSQGNNTFDVLLGGTSTASAKFGFLNNAGGTPTASISANSGDNALFLTGTGNLGTTNRQTLTLGGSTTGNIALSNNTLLTGSLTGYAMTIDNTNSTEDGLRIDIEGSTSSEDALYVTTNNGSVAALRVAGDGRTKIGGSGSGLAWLMLDPPNLTISDSTERPGFTSATQIITLAEGQTLSDHRQNIFNAPFIAGTAGGGTETVTTASTLYIDAAPTLFGGNAAITNAYALFVDDGTARFDGNVLGPTTGIMGFLQRSSGALAPTNRTDDLLLGGTSTASAKFAFINNAGGTPTASISANTGNNATFLTGTGNFGTTNRQTLALGGSTTGDITLNARNGSGFVGINTTSPTAPLQLSHDGNSGLKIKNTVAEADLNIFMRAGGSGGTGVGIFESPGGDGNEPYIFAFYDSINLQDVFSLGKYQQLTNLRTNLDVQGYATVSGNLTLYDGNRSIQTTHNNTLSLGGTTTGNILINSDGSSFLGIGTTNPLTTLHVSGSENGSRAAFILNNANSGDLFTASASGTTRFTIANNGNLTATGLANTNQANAVCYDTSTGAITYNSGSCSASSARFKHDIVSIDNLSSLEKVMDLRPVNFRYNSDYTNDQRLQLGFIAEEVNLIDSTLVDFESDGITPSGVKYMQMSALLTAAMQEQQGQIEEIKNSLDLNGTSQNPTFNDVISNKLTSNTVEAQTLKVGGQDINETIDSKTSTTAAKLADQENQLSSLLLDIKTQNEMIASLSARINTLEDSSVFNLLSFASSSANFVTVADDLLVLGNSTFNNAAIVDTLSIGNTMQITGNSIDTIGETLALQPLRQGSIDIMGGAITIDTDGKAVFTKDVRFEGIVEANIIKGIDDKLTVSGSASFDNVAVKKLDVAGAVNEDQSAGVATLEAGETEIVIENTNVTSESLIFLTPTSGISGQSLFIKAKSDGESFTVGLPQTVSNNIEFNYLIIN